MGRRNPAPVPALYKARGTRLGNAVCRSRTSPPSSASLPLPIGGHSSFSVPGQEERRAGLMASNYVDTAAEEGRFHGHYHHSTTPTSAAAASPKQMRRSWSSASSGHGHGHGHGAAPKCVCAPATHPGSFKCRLHRSSSHGHGHPTTPPSPATSAAPPPAVPPPSSRTVAAQ
ncbi:unnamed protein product [Urochloa humidicola]